MKATFLAPLAVVTVSLMGLSACSTTSTQEINSAPEGSSTYTSAGAGTSNQTSAPQTTQQDTQSLVAAHCNARSLSHYRGQRGSAGLYSQMLQESGAGIQRLITPQSIVTMDYRNNRLDIRIDDQGKILNAYCG